MKIKIAQTLISAGLLLASELAGADSNTTSLPAPKRTAGTYFVSSKPVLINQPRIYSGTFFTAMGGPSIINWNTFTSTPFVSTRANGTGGVTYGFSSGFRFYSYFGIEGGYLRFPTVKGIGYTNASLPPTLQSIGVSSWAGYVVGRFYIGLPPFEYFYITLGAGLVYRQVNPKPVTFFTNNQAYYYSSIFNIGVEWDIVQDWFVFMNYFYIPAFDRDYNVQTVKFFNKPPTNVFLFGIGYKFSI